MAVLLDTSAGEIVIDLYVKDCPVTTGTFLELCKNKFYNNCLFWNVQQNYIVQSGDPTGTGKGVKSPFEVTQKNGIEGEITKSLRHDKIGLVSMASNPKNANQTQFFFSLRSEDLDHLDDKHVIFGEVSEGIEVLEVLNNLYCDEDGRPFQDVRIKHTYILDNPFSEDDSGPPSPECHRPPGETVNERISYEDSLDNVDDVALQKSEEELEQSIKRKEAHSRAIVLEMTGDLPDADVKPPVEVLFVCKLNAVTTDADLEIIFSRFGTIRKCEIIKDFKTGDSLNYAFIEYEVEDACLEAYEKMNNVLIGMFLVITI